MAKKREYNKTKWVNNVTKLNADNLNNIEEGIHETRELALDNSTLLEQASTAVSSKMSASYQAEILKVEIGDSETPDFQGSAEIRLGKTELGLGNVDNTSDADKPVSAATELALTTKADLVNGKLKGSQFPSLGPGMSLNGSTLSLTLSSINAEVVPKALSLGRQNDVLLLGELDGRISKIRASNLDYTRLKVTGNEQEAMNSIAENDFLFVKEA